MAYLPMKKGIFSVPVVCRVTKMSMFEYRSAALLSGIAGFLRRQRQKSAQPALANVASAERIPARSGRDDMLVA